MNRREVIALLGSTAGAWPLPALCQQASIPVIGWIGIGSREGEALRIAAFRRGLNENGFVEGRNVLIEYRWAENEPDRLPALVADLVRQRVSLIATAGGPATALAAKKATTTIPIVFIVGADPVKLGLVANLARPGGNLTGTNFFAFELVAKRLDVLRQLIPGLAKLAVMINPTDSAIAEATLADVKTTAGSMGLQVQVLEATTGTDISAAFVTISRERPDALLISTGSFFTDRRMQLALSAVRYSIPTVSGTRAITEAGGLMSYGASLAEALHQSGVYAARILKGAKPEDLPVIQSTKFEFVLNAQTARLLNLTIPASLLAIADEVIE